MVTPVIHAKTESLRELAKQLDAAAVFAKPIYVKELVDRLLTVISEQQHALDGLDKRVALLERFPELRE